MHIRLHGLPFDEKLIAELEENLLQEEFCLEDFALHKQRDQDTVPGSYYGQLNTSYIYTVFVKDKKFSISFSDDFQFLRFFYNLCCAPENKESHQSGMLDGIIKRVESCIEATKHWLTEDPFSSQ